MRTGGRTGPADWVRRGRAARAWLGEARVRPEDPLALRVLVGLVSVDARDRVLILAGQAFIALMPLLIVAASALTSLDGEAVGTYFVDRYDLGGDAALAVETLFSRPPEAASGITLTSLVLLLVSLTSLGRSARRTVERSWQMPVTRGLRGSASGLLGVLALVLLVAVVSALAVAARASAPAPRLLLTAAEVVVAVPGWLLVTWLLLCGLRPWRHLVPGAVFGAVALVGASIASSVWLPRLFEANAARYGAIGIAFTLVAWLVVFAAVLVAVGVVGAELARRPRAGA